MSSFRWTRNGGLNYSMMDRIAKPSVGGIVIPYYLRSKVPGRSPVFA